MTPTMNTNTKVEPAINLRRLLDLEPMPKRGPISSQTYATVKPKQYRNSYPPSRRKTHEHPESDEFHAVDDGLTSARPVPNPSVQGEGASRPRRSSLRQPQDFSKSRRRKSTSAKRVHFSMAETVYEPFGPQDVQTVDQILDLLRIPSRKIPYTSSHSITLRVSEAAHDYPEPIVSSRERIRNTRPLSAELVEGPSTSESRSNFPQMHKAEAQDQSELISRRSSHRQSDTYHEHHPEPQPRADEVDYPQSQGVTEAKLDHRSSSHYQHRTRSHTEPRSSRDAHSHYRPRSHISENVEDAAPGRQRSSISSDETLINPEVTWAPASKVMFVKQQGRSESVVDADKPIVTKSEEKASLRRSGAQRLPKVPRRHKLLHNLTKMFE